MKNKINFNLKKKYLLNNNNDYKFIYNYKKITINYFFIFYKKNKLLYPRIGIKVYKNNILKSFKRNKIKRIIKENFRIKKNYIKNIDIILILNKFNNYNISEIKLIINYIFYIFKK